MDVVWHYLFKKLLNVFDFCGPEINFIPDREHMFTNFYKAKKNVGNYSEQEI